MNTDTAQVMRVVGRCLVTAAEDAGPDVTAAAARAGTDPRMHQAIAGVLTATDRTRTWATWHGAMSAVRDADTIESAAACLLCSAHTGESAPARRGAVLTSGQAAAGHDCAGQEECAQAGSFNELLTRCTAAARELALPGNETARMLFQLIVTAIVVERSTLGDRDVTRLRNAVAHDDIAVTLSRSVRHRRRNR